MSFEPIAIIGRGCVLPGAYSPQELWHNTTNNISGITAATDPIWHKYLLETLPQPGQEGIPTLNAGHICSFEKYLYTQDYRLDKALLEQLDPVFTYLLYAAKQACGEAGLSFEALRQVNAGAIIGNLSYPTFELGNYANTHLLSSQYQRIDDSEYPHPFNRYMSRYPVKVLSEVFNLNQEGFMVEAACASSLYAINQACLLL